MNANETLLNANKPMDGAYLEIWKVEQEHTRTRWTVATFFFSISFAIFGFSFQTQVTAGLSINHIQRLVAVMLYWFALLLFVQFHRYTNFLRAQLRKMETSNLVSFTLETDANKMMYSKLGRLFSATRLLFYFGFLYTAGVAVLMLLQI